MLQMCVIMLHTCILLIINEVKSFKNTVKRTKKYFLVPFWHGSCLSLYKSRGCFVKLFGKAFSKIRLRGESTEVSHLGNIAFFGL